MESQKEEKSQVVSEGIQSIGKAELCLPGSPDVDSYRDDRSLGTAQMFQVPALGIIQGDARGRFARQSWLWW